jgi:hypothetical protein
MPTGSESAGLIGSINPSLNTQGYVSTDVEPYTNVSPTVNFAPINIGSGSASSSGLSSYLIIGAVALISIFFLKSGAI